MSSYKRYMDGIPAANLLEQKVMVRLENVARNMSEMTPPRPRRYNVTRVMGLAAAAVIIAIGTFLGLRWFPNSLEGIAGASGTLHSVSAIVTEDPTTEEADLDQAAFLELLEENSFVIDDIQNHKAQDGMLLVPFTSLRFGEDEDSDSITIYRFGTKELAETNAGYIDADGYHISHPQNTGAVEYHLPPHWFKKDLLIVLYNGMNEDMVTFLRNTLGSEFAGNTNNKQRVSHTLYDYLGKTKEELEALAGTFKESMWYNGPVYKFGNYWFGFSGSLGLDQDLPIGTSTVVYGKLEDLINGMEGDITPAELDVLFGQSGKREDVEDDNRILSYQYGAATVFIQFNKLAGETISPETEVTLRLSDTIETAG